MLQRPLTLGSSGLFPGRIVGTNPTGEMTHEAMDHCGCLLRKTCGRLPCRPFGPMRKIETCHRLHHLPVNCLRMLRRTDSRDSFGVARM